MSDDRIRNLRIQADHCFGIRPDQIQMAARMGQTFACNFDTENTRIIEKDYGEEYLAWNAPVASMLKAGVNTVLGSFGTYGRLRYSPFEDGVHWLTREDENGQTWGLKDEAVPDRLTLLLMMSRFGGHPLWRENAIGSIEVGKLADIVILNGDYMAVAVQDLNKLTSIFTMVGGKVNFEDPLLRGNTLRFNSDSIDWTFDMQTPTTLWRWTETPVAPSFLHGANGY